MKAPRYTVGLMSGTSLDGVDAVLVDFEAGDGKPLAIVAFSNQGFSAEFKAELLALNQSGGVDELHRAATAGNQLAHLYAQAVADLLAQPAVVAIGGKAAVSAIGAHGQTVRHQPSSNPLSSYTLQLNQPALLAELTGIAVVADFRSRDIAAGGQGAPLVPAFHQQIFSQKNQSIAVLNIGGMANISILPPLGSDAPVIGFDCGPGNVLMDAWCQQHTGQAFDEGGAWAAQGRVLPELLSSLLDMPFFSQPPPKSCGRDGFSMAWLAAKLAPFTASAKPVDIQATLAELTSKAVITCMSSYGNDSKTLIVCGGGAFNQHLVQRLQTGLPGVKVQLSSSCGLPAQQVEAAAFAWLARQTLLGLPGNLPSVTGASGLRVLGAVYPA